METFSVLLALCAGNSPVTGEFPAQRPVTRSFDVFFDLRLNKRLSKQPWVWWFETQSWSSWRHSNDPRKCPWKRWLQNVGLFVQCCWRMNNITVMLQATYPILFPLMEMLELQIWFDWNVFLYAKLMINRHWFGNGLVPPGQQATPSSTATSQGVTGTQWVHFLGRYSLAINQPLSAVIHIIMMFHTSFEAVHLNILVPLYIYTCHSCVQNCFFQLTVQNII